MALEINTQVVIKATPERIWNVFTNYKEYTNWNPFIKSITGDVREGNTIKVKLDTMVFKPKVLVFKQNQKLEWKGKLLMPGLFDGKHAFELVHNEDGTTTFIQKERFTGILVPLFKKKLLSDTKSGFEAMNEALKKVSEG